MPKPGWTTLRQDDAMPWITPWATGRFYGSPFINGFTAATATDSAFRAIPIYVPNVAGVTVTAVGVEVTSGGTSSNSRFGIYGTDAEGRPTELIIDGGSAATTGTGFVSASISQFLRQGWYYLAAAHSGSVLPTIRKTGVFHGNAFGDPHSTDLAIYHGYQSLNSSVACAAIVSGGFPAYYPTYTDLKPVQELSDRLMVTL